MLSRGQGARVSLLTLTRGESGDNAIGPELFDALGLIRTEELLVADRYYGVDRQYFGTMVDYGFSKRLDETLEKWGKQIRPPRRRRRHPHRAAVRAHRAVPGQRARRSRQSFGGRAWSRRRRSNWRRDPAVFPEQIAAGLRPWQPLKLYMGGVRENEDWTFVSMRAQYDPVLGDSYQSFARLGLSFQRSQNGGQLQPAAGPVGVRTTSVCSRWSRLPRRRRRFSTAST